VVITDFLILNAGEDFIGELIILIETISGLGELHIY